MSNKVFKNEYTSQIIHIKDKKKIDYYTEDIIVREFNESQMNKRIIANNFNDDIWYMKDNNYNVSIQFNDISSEFKSSVKCFALSCINNNMNSTHISKKINGISKMIKITDRFNDDKLNDCKKAIIEMKTSVSAYTSQATYSYLQFLNNHRYNIYISLFNRYKRRVSNLREIKGFRQIFKFDIILNDFFNNCNDDYKAKYFPIFLWWKITTIIPMRPIEFAELPYNCCYKLKDKYYIKIMRRNKGQVHREELRTEQILEINKYIYDIINEYKNLVNKYINEERKYLISYLLYNRFLSKPNASIKRKNNIKFLELRQYHTLINKFHNEVILGIYEDNMKKFALIDTRHIAIMNLYLQGLNPYTIAMMAYHKKVTTQNSYYNHLETYIDSYALELAYNIKRIKENGIKLDIRTIFDNEELITRSKIEMINGTKGFPIENGFCLDKEFPKNCFNLTCLDCMYYIVDINKVDTMESSKMANLRKIDIKLSEQLQLLKYLSNELLKKKNNEAQDLYEQQIKNTTDCITRTIIKKSAILSNGKFDLRK